MEIWTPETIRRERKSRGLTQEVVAQEAGLSHRSHLSRIETGAFDPKLSTVNKILEALERLSEDQDDGGR